MLTTATSAAFALDNLGLVCEMFAAEIQDRAPILSPTDITKVILLASAMKKQLLECENDLPKLKRKKVEQYHGPKTPVHRRPLNEAIATEVNGQATAHKKAKR
jgi:hypothetical protein